MSIWQCTSPTCGALTGPNPGPCPTCGSQTQFWSAPIIPNAVAGVTITTHYNDDADKLAKAERERDAAQEQTRMAIADRDAVSRDAADLQTELDAAITRGDEFRTDMLAAALERDAAISVIKKTLADYAECVSESGVHDKGRTQLYTELHENLTELCREAGLTLPEPSTAP
jgi:hypothetical protein